MQNNIFYKGGGLLIIGGLNSLLTGIIIKLLCSILILVSKFIRGRWSWRFENYQQIYKKRNVSNLKKRFTKIKSLVTIQRFNQ